MVVHHLELSGTDESQNARRKNTDHPDVIIAQEAGKEAAVVTAKGIRRMTTKQRAMTKTHEKQSYDGGNVV